MNEVEEVPASFMLGQFSLTSMNSEMLHFLYYLFI